MVNLWSLRYDVSKIYVIQTINVSINKNNYLKKKVKLSNDLK